VRNLSQLLANYSCNPEPSYTSTFPVILGALLAYSSIVILARSKPARARLWASRCCLLAILVPRISCATATSQRRSTQRLISVR